MNKADKMVEYSKEKMISTQMQQSSQSANTCDCCIKTDENEQKMPLAAASQTDLVRLDRLLMLLRRCVQVQMTSLQQVEQAAACA